MNNMFFRYNYAMLTKPLEICEEKPINNTDIAKIIFSNTDNSVQVATSKYFASLEQVCQSFCFNSRVLLNLKRKSCS